MTFATNKGARIHWEEKGEGSPVLLIMGHRYSSRLWYPVRDVLAARHRVIWFDNRGTGQSDTTVGITLDDLAKDALAVMDAAGVEAAHVYGVSMGGVITLELALLQPGRVRSLILGCTGILTPDKPRMPPFLRILYRLPPAVRRFLFRRRGHGYGSAAAADKVARDQAVLADDPATVPGQIAQAAAVAGYSVTLDAVRGLTMPALVLHGDEDSVVPMACGEELAGTLSHAEFLKLEGAGHNYFIARAEEANAAVLAFLDRCDGATAP